MTDAHARAIEVARWEEDRAGLIEVASVRGAAMRGERERRTTQDARSARRERIASSEGSVTFTLLSCDDCAPQIQRPSRSTRICSRLAIRPSLLPAARSIVRPKAMSSSGILPAPTMPSDPDCLDLGALLAPLSREDVELMVVKLLSKHPEDAGWVVAASRKPVDTLEVFNEVKSATANATSISGCLSDLESHVSRADDFLRSGHVRNAVAMLEVMSAPIVSWLVEQGDLDELEDPEDKQSLQAFTALLENSWQNAIDKAVIVRSDEGTKASSVSEPTTLSRSSGADKAQRARLGKLPYTSLSTSELTHAQSLLTNLMSKLKPTQGAIFSDPLRGINRKIKAAAAAPAAAAAAAAASPIAGSKRKADDSAAEPAASDVSSTTASPAADADAAESSSSSSAAATDASPSLAAATPASSSKAPAGKAPASGSGSAAKRAKTNSKAAAAK